MANSPRVVLRTRRCAQHSVDIAKGCHEGGDARAMRAAKRRGVVDEQAIDGRRGQREGDVMSGITTDDRAVNMTSYLAVVMIGGRRGAAYRGGGSETPRDQQAMRARKVEGRESQKEEKKELRGDQATNSGGNVRVLGCAHTPSEVIVDPEDENESNQTRFNL